ncbi:hypothetical protein BJF78_26175 [Pseudonocardia sp. CNS-139]|nr:hypothetical protein BJF78_26175 [Pseudonocardia sp. CNS-139]
MSTPTIETVASTSAIDPDAVDPDAEFDLDIRIFESGGGLDEIIRMTDDNCGATCQSACTSC